MTRPEAPCPARREIVYPALPYHLAMAKDDGVRVECGRCSSDSSGYTRSELLSEGWRWLGPKNEFVMCPGCVENLKPVWEAKRQEAA